MAKFLADCDIAKLIGTFLINADQKYIDPNGIELRLGKHLRFRFKGEEKELREGFSPRVVPAETLTISSFEQIDFRDDTIQKIFPNSMIMGLITPTTTMMREGISEAQVATKIDAGFRGTLN
jgi:deoxycytidine triphosphate deaminase